MVFCTRLTAILAVTALPLARALVFPVPFHFNAASLSSLSTSLSSQCQKALLGLVANTDSAACLNINRLLIGVSTLNTSSSTADEIAVGDKWLTGICAAQPCSDDTIAQITTNVTVGCGAGALKILGLDESQVESAIPEIQKVYPVVRRIACLKDTTKNVLCFTEDVQTLFDSSTLSVKMACTNCTKEAYNIAKEAGASFLNATIDQAINKQCGATFTDGTSPSDIQETAVEAKPQVTLSGSGRTHTMMAMSVLLALAGVIRLRTMSPSATSHIA